MIPGQLNHEELPVAFSTAAGGKGGNDAGGDPSMLRTGQDGVAIRSHETFVLF